MGNSSKFTSVRGESCRTGVIMSDEHCKHTEKDVVPECCP